MQITDEKTTTRTHRHDVLFAALSCASAMTLIVLGDWTLNIGLHPALAQLVPIAREASSIAKVATFFVVAVMCYMYPKKLQLKALSLAAGCMAVVAAVLLMIGLRIGSPVVLLVGAPILAVARAWACIIVGSALVSLPTSTCMKSVFAAFIATAALRTFVGGSPDGVLSAALLAVMCVGSLTLAIAPARPQFVAAHETGRELSVLSVEQPSSVLPFSHKVFVAIFLFSLAFGYSLTFRSVNGAPAISALSGLLLLLVLTTMLMGKPRFDFDVLYRVAVLMILAGLLISLVPHAPDTFTNVLLSSGSECFQALVWCLLAAIGRQNIYAALSMVAWGQFALQGGVLCGTTLGHVVNSAYAQSPDVLPLITCIIIFVFVAYQIVALAGLSFEATIRGIQPAQSLVVSDRAIEFEHICKEIGNEYDLTQRESEIFLLMAKGRNNRFIQEELCLSHNTVKTHIMHIYAKLGVHSHQELIDLAEHW